MSTTRKFLPFLTHSSLWLSLLLLLIVGWYGLVINNQLHQPDHTNHHRYLSSQLGSATLALPATAHDAKIDRQPRLAKHEATLVHNLDANTLLTPSYQPSPGPTALSAWLQSSIKKPIQYIIGSSLSLLLVLISALLIGTQLGLTATQHQASLLLLTSWMLCSTTCLASVVNPNTNSIVLIGIALLWALSRHDQLSPKLYCSCMVLLSLLKPTVLLLTLLKSGQPKYPLKSLFIVTCSLWLLPILCGQPQWSVLASWWQILHHQSWLMTTMLQPGNASLVATLTKLMPYVDRTSTAFIFLVLSTSTMALLLGWLLGKQKIHKKISTVTEYDCYFAGFVCITLLCQPITHVADLNILCLPIVVCARQYLIQPIRVIPWLLAITSAMLNLERNPTPILAKLVLAQPDIPYQLPTLSYFGCFIALLGLMSALYYGYPGAKSALFRSEPQLTLGQRQQHLLLAGLIGMLPFLISQLRTLALLSIV